MGLGGLAVEVRLNVSIDFYFKMGELAEVIKAEDAEATRELLRYFADGVLESWNFHDRHGNPVPATPDGFLQLDMLSALMVVTHYRKLIGRVPDPLAGISGNGNTSKAPKVSTSRRRSVAPSS